MPEITMHWVSNRGVDSPGEPEGLDIRFVASFENYDQAAVLKEALDGREPHDRGAIIFHSLVRRRPGERASHEAWHVDQGKKGSEIAKEPHVTPLSFDVFEGPKEHVDNALKNWDRAVLCDAVTQILRGYSQTGDPTGGR
jgi:hypothetical protein